MRRVTADVRSGGAPSLVRKLLIVQVIGGLTFLITSLVGEDVISSVLLSVFTGGVVLVVQYLAEFQYHLAESQHRLQAVEEQLRSGLASVNEATALFGQLEHSAIPTDLVKQLVRHSASLDHSTHPLIHRLADDEIAKVSDSLKGLSNHGEITYDGEDRDWLLSLTRNAQKTINVTSFISIDASGQGFHGGLWDTDLGQRYLEAQQKAVDRGVKIRRIFILDAPERVEDPELRRICKVQRDLGIQVRVLDPLTLSKLHLNWMFDFAVFDSAISYETTPAAWAESGTKPAIVNTRLVLSLQRVAERAEGHQMLWAVSSDPSLGEGHAMRVVEGHVRRESRGGVGELNLNDVTVGSGSPLLEPPLDDTAALAELTAVYNSAREGQRRIFQVMPAHSLPISIFLGSAAGAAEVELALIELLGEVGVDITKAMPPIIGSWFSLMLGHFRRLLTSTEADEVVSRIERMIQVHMLDQPQADVDSKQAEAVARLMAALEKQENACIQIGSIFLIKVDGTLIVRNLSPRELSFLRQYPSALSSPRQVLDLLEKWSNQSRSPQEVLPFSSDSSDHSMNEPPDPA